MILYCHFGLHSKIWNEISIHQYQSGRDQACQLVQQDAPSHPEKHNCLISINVTIETEGLRPSMLLINSIDLSKKKIER